MSRYASFLTKHHNPSLALDLVRIYLGAALAVRGVLFVIDSSILLEFASTPERDWFLPAAIMHYIIPAHLVGGIMLAVGFLTRIAALVQIPVIAGAVFLVHLEEGLLASGQSLELSALVLVLLLVILFSGAGKLSLDYMISRQAGVAEHM